MRAVQPMRLEGTHYQMGLQLGRRYAGFSNFKADVESIRIDKAVLSSQVAVHAKHFPNYLDFVCGIADGAKVAKDKLAYHLIAKYVETGGCTIIGVRTKTGTIIGRNYDWIGETKGVFEAYTCIFPRGHASYSFTSITDMDVEPEAKNPLLYHKPIDIINERGLFVGITYAFHENKYGIGLPSNKVVQLIAERCEKVEDAIKLVDQVPMANPKNIFIADRFGNMAVVEHTSKEFRVIRPEKGVLVKANHFLHPDLAKQDTVPKGHTSFARYDAALDAVRGQTGEMTFDAMKSIISAAPIYKDEKAPYPTIWQLAIVLAKSGYLMEAFDPKQQFFTANSRY